MKSYPDLKHNMPVLYVWKKNKWTANHAFAFASKMFFDVSCGNLYRSDSIQ